jgi:hypothetical protein
MGKTYDESFMLASAMESLKHSILQQDGGLRNNYKCVIVDIDDGSVMPRHFMSEVEAILATSSSVAAIGVFACSSTLSSRVINMCEKAGMKFIPKPVTED